MKTIRLTNGPYNNCVITDSGVIRIRMALVHRSHRPGTRVGEAIYLPNKKRNLAFWDGNIWTGELVEIIPV